MDTFTGKSVSIRCKRGLGVFQGTITRAQSDKITINNAFHNGNKIKDAEAEVRHIFGL